jgi:hypothetical protein
LNSAFNRSSATGRLAPANSTVDIACNTLAYVFAPLGLSPLDGPWCPAPMASPPPAAMILHLCLNEMVLQSSEHELSLRQRQPDGPARLFVTRRAAANLVSAHGPIRPGHLQHDPPLHPPRFPDKADPSTPRFWTVSRGVPEQMARRPSAEAPESIRMSGVSG